MMRLEDRLVQPAVILFYVLSMYDYATIYLCTSNQCEGSTKRHMQKK